MGGFFVVPPKTVQEISPAEEKAAELTEKDTSFSYQLLSRLQSDCEYFLGAGQGHEKHLWAGNVKNQIAKMWELYNAVPEKPNWLTAQDIERYEKQMAGVEQKAASVDTPITSVPDLNVQPTDIQTTSSASTLDEEEISDLIDVVLCADDITPDTREWAAEIHKFFEGGHKQTTKAKILKAYYGKLDTDYITETGEHLYLTAGEDGLTFEIEGQQFTEDYGKLTARIDRLILTGAYPFSSADTVIDDYAIPDEQEEMQSIADEDEDSPDEPPASAELSETDRQKIIDEYLQHGSGTQGGRQRIFQAMLSMPAKKDRVAFIRKEYYSYGSSRSQPGGDRWRLEYTPKGLAIDYRSGSLALHETLSWNQVESGISDLIRQDRYLTEKDKAELEAEGQTVYLPAPEKPAQEAPDRQLTLFDITSAMPESYEDTAEDSNDGMIDGNSMEPVQMPFQEGDRIYYHDRVFEIVKFLHDGRTVEIGDIAQLKNLNGLKITERVPLSAIADCKPLKDHYTNGEIATMVVESVQSGDFSEETQAAIQAATLVNQSNDEYNRTIMDDFHARAWGEGFNYRYSPDHHLYDGGPKTKFKNNIAAIRLLKELQAQGRPATAEEQITLARFVGWGGLANALTPDKSGWETEYAEIKELLTDEELQAAQKSTLTSYYTEQSIVSHIYKGLERMGFRGGNILDPALGTGNFFSVLPDSMESSKLYGCEIDSIPGQIAKQLYPNADIQVMGFEKTAFPDHFFDMMVGNVPFNSIKVDDPRYNKHNFHIHDYFIAKSLDKVRPGCLLYTSPSPRD